VIITNLKEGKVDLILFQGLTRAEKYCNACNKYICNECVIGIHGEHIKEAKYSLKDSFVIKNEYFQQLNKKIKSLSEEFYSKDFSNKTPNFQVVLYNKSMKFISELELIKKTLETLIESEKSFQEKIKRMCEEYFKRKVGFKIKELEDGIKDSK